ncbi:MAG TPA: hypothetical protein VIK13_08875, partial [Candidatus Limnocylindrales bacterium]
MTRSTRPPGRQAGPRDPRAATGRGVPLAAILSIVGLLVVALGTLSLSSGNLPLPVSGGQGPDSSGNPGVAT